MRYYIHCVLKFFWLYSWQLVVSLLTCRHMGITPLHNLSHWRKYPLPLIALLTWIDFLPWKPLGILACNHLQHAAVGPPPTKPSDIVQNLPNGSPLLLLFCWGSSQPFPPISTFVKDSHSYVGHDRACHAPLACLSWPTWVFKNQAL